MISSELEHQCYWRPAQKWACFHCPQICRSLQSRPLQKQKKPPPCMYQIIKEIQISSRWWLVLTWWLWAQCLLWVWLLRSSRCCWRPGREARGPACKCKMVCSTLPYFDFKRYLDFFQWKRVLRTFLLQVVILQSVVHPWRLCSSFSSMGESQCSSILPFKDKPKFHGVDMINFLDLQDVRHGHRDADICWDIRPCVLVKYKRSYFPIVIALQINNNYRQSH